MFEVNEKEAIKYIDGKLEEFIAILNKENLSYPDKDYDYTFRSTQDIINQLFPDEKNSFKLQTYPVIGVTADRSESARLSEFKNHINRCINQLIVYKEKIINFWSVASTSEKISNNGSKPLIFISHAAADADLANAIKCEIDKVFRDKIDIFCTSFPKTITTGDEWLEEIESKLNVCKYLILLVSPKSIYRKWFWLELGTVWLKRKRKECRILPLCTPGMKNSLPVPIERLQAKDIGKDDEIRYFIEEIVRNEKFGDVGKLEIRKIIEKIPNYKKLSKEDVEIEINDIKNLIIKSEEKTELTDIAKDILLEAAQDKSGQILILKALGGIYTISTNGRNITGNNAREIAAFKAAIDKLYSYQLLEPIGDRGECFILTDSGYTLADELSGK